MINSFTGKYRFLSNFYPAIVEYDGMSYPSTEHAFQAAKTLNQHARIPFQVGGSFTAGQAKRHGKTLDLRPDWEKVKVAIMYELNDQKFQDVVLRQQLLATGTEMLVEGNDWNDTFWGVCNGEGSNFLGEILMKVREIAARE